ncbi:MAG: LysR family transcriptional regulator [Gemmatimonadaceae bacterium]
MPGSSWMELRHLRYFTAVADAGSFVGAAGKLHLAQPALSRQIRDLERLLHAELFVRDARGAELTPAGQACRFGAERILRDADAALEHARLAAQGLAGRCVIGASRVLVWNGLVARVIERVRREFPGIEIAVEEQSFHAQWNALSDCTTDLGLGSPPPRDYTQLSHETHALDVMDSAAFSRQHRFATRDTITLEELADEIFIHRDGVDSFRLVRAEFARRGFKPRTERSVETLDSLLVLVCAGTGWTIIPRSVRHFVTTNAAVVPIEGFGVPAAYARIWRRNESRPVVRTVLSLLRRMSDEMQLGGAGASNVAASNGNGDTNSRTAARLELRHLRYFTAIIDEGSIGRAAERLGLTQPALSRQVRDLEGVVGAALIERVTRGVTPTMAGEAFHVDARRILESAERLAGDAQRATRGANGRCIIGFVPTATVHDVVTRVMGEVATRLPNLAVSVIEVATPKQAEALMDGRIDLGMGHTYPAPDADEPILKVPLADDALDTALLATGSPLARQASVSLSELADVPFLFMTRAFSPGFYDLVMGALARAGYRARVHGEYDGLPTVWALAAKNMGWCLAPHSQRLCPPPGLVAVPLSEFQLAWGAHLVCRDQESSASVLAVRDLVLRVAAGERGEA